MCTSLINIIRLCYENAAASFYFFVLHMRECSQADSVLIWYMDPAFVFPCLLNFRAPLLEHHISDASSIITVKYFLLVHAKEAIVLSSGIPI